MQTLLRPEDALTILAGQVLWRGLANVFQNSQAMTDEFASIAMRTRKRRHYCVILVDLRGLIFTSAWTQPCQCIPAQPNFDRSVHLHRNDYSVKRCHCCVSWADYNFRYNDDERIFSACARRVRKATLRGSICRSKHRRLARLSNLL